MAKLSKLETKTLPKARAAPHHHTDFTRGEYRTPELLGLVSGIMAPEDAVLKKIRAETALRGLPPISIGPDEGKILDFLVRACGAKKAVEVGTLAGYSACWIARALPASGRLHTLEYDGRHAAVARDNIKQAGLAGKVTVIEGSAVETLPGLEPSGPFDFCFIDADKANYPNYLRWAVQNVRSGGIVVGDNAYLFGKLHLNPEQAGEDRGGVHAMRAFLKIMANRTVFSSCAMLPTGEGMAVAVRK